MHSIIRINSFAGARNVTTKSWNTSGPLSWPNVDVTPDDFIWGNPSAASALGPWINNVVQVTGTSARISVFYNYGPASDVVNVYRRVSPTAFGTNDYELNPSLWTIWTGGLAGAIPINPANYFGIAVGGPVGLGTLNLYNFTDSNRFLGSVSYSVQGVM